MNYRPGAATALKFYRGGVAWSTQSESEDKAFWSINRTMRSRALILISLVLLFVRPSFATAQKAIVAKDSTGSSTFNCDPIRKRLSSVNTVLGGLNFTVSYGYYPDGKLQFLTTPAAMAR